MNHRIFDFLSQSRILPKSQETEGNLEKIERIVFHDNLRVSHWTRHFVKNGNVMVIGSLGYMSYAHSPAHRFTSAAFCSIATGVRMMGNNHPYSRVSTHPVSYGPFYREAARELGASSEAFSKSYDGTPKPTRIHHDVWIGGDVLLAGGLTIGTGSILAANAVVTKNVPPYAIVAGMPAKIIKYRFPKAVIQRLLDTKWWQYPLEQLAEFEFDDPMAFCDAFERRKSRMIPRQPRIIMAQDILALR
ncbi:CatB-related O-acetyltransferase [Paracoccus simplex]|uniref:CatB-related O-acetyltransferase n=1 Tax=Paracoccus simplex TaxID=2086346 RepID=A0ABV7RWJ7_9RHOB